MCNGTMITVIDYGIGNLRSIEKAFEHVGANVLRTNRPDAIAQASHLVLPGVGAFGACIGEVRRQGLAQPILSAVQRGIPFLGICVGMQMLFDVGMEDGEHLGLAILPGRIERFRFPARSQRKVPQIGWNQVVPRNPSPLLAGIDAPAWCYFVHSYYAQPAKASDIVATTSYGPEFPSVVGRGTVYGVQFHPEKSQHTGLRILENFATLR